MRDFNAFMAGNALADETVKYVVSNRFKVKGKPVAWEIKAVDSAKDELIRKECTKKVPIAGKRGQFNLETDNDEYIAKLCAASIVYPELDNAELQDSYGVKSAKALLGRMLKPGEYAELKLKVMEVNGFDVTMDELVDEAKN